jgi:phage-related protein
VDNAGSGLWEVRSRLNDRIARVLFYITGNKMILLHGFIKKTQKTPQQELDLAKKRKQTHIKQEKKDG